MDEINATTTRRSFLGAMLAACAAPAIARSGVLMPVFQARERLPVLWLDGVHDDGTGLTAWLNGERVMRPGGRIVGDRLVGESIFSRQTIRAVRPAERALKGVSIVFHESVENRIVVASSAVVVRHGRGWREGPDIQGCDFSGGNPRRGTFLTYEGGVRDLKLPSFSVPLQGVAPSASTKP